MDFLWELVPEATIVHIKRHPVAVVASHVDQSWAPPTVDGLQQFLKLQLAQEYGGDGEAYVAGKRAFVVRVLASAGLEPGRR